MNEIRRKIAYFKTFSVIRYDNDPSILTKSIDAIEYSCYMDRINFTNICPLKSLYDSSKFDHMLDMNALSCRKDLNYKIIDKYKDRLNWSLLSSNKALTLGFIKRYYKYINFRSLSCSRCLTYEIASNAKVRKKLVPNAFVYSKLDEKVAELFINEIDLPRYVCANKNISAKFYKDHVLRQLYMI